MMAGRIPSQLIGLCLAGSLASTIPPAKALAAQTSLSLTCYGEVEIRQAGKATAAGAAAPPYHAHVLLRLSGGDARIQLPQGFRPNAHDDGWYRIKYLKASDGEIIGNAIISFIDKPFFRVDRISGRMDVSGLGGTFSGECRQADR
jgi:hypothetical protein